MRWHGRACIVLRRLPILEANHFPAYVVWELTLRCDQRCLHCGSRAAFARDAELTTDEAIDVAQQLADSGAREVVLIGGEAYLHAGFLDVVATFRRLGIRVGMTTGGRGVTRALAREMKRAGIYHTSVSIDGLRSSHNKIRNNPLSFDGAVAALHALGDAGIRVAVNTNVNRFNQHDLEPLYDLLRPLGVFAWQIQLTAPLGRAADRPEMLLQPFDLLDVVPRIAALKTRAYADGVRLMPGNNLGYFGPEEGLLRSACSKDSDHWGGCQAGKLVLGIESDGAIKGCPSLQSDVYRSKKTLREAKLTELWQDARVAFNRDRDHRSLWGYCAECPYAKVCRGGCSFTAHGFFGRPGNNPYCHFRAREFDKRGLRERLTRVAKAPGRPFDHAKFSIVVESSSSV